MADCRCECHQRRWDAPPLESFDPLVHAGRWLRKTWRALWP